RVMTLLPYGARSRLSASTWASSTFREHRLRLFFAAAERTKPEAEARDHLVAWDQPGHGPIGHTYADAYLDWLSQDVPRRIARLAGETQEMGFGRREVLEMLERLKIAADPPAQAIYMREMVPWSPAWPATPASVEDLLSSCAEQLQTEKPDLT